VAEEPSPGQGEAKEDPRSKGWGNLRPATKGDANRNPAGNNGWRKAQSIIAKFMEEPDPDDPAARSRFLCLLGKEYGRALDGKGFSAKLLIEQTAGRARVQIDVSNEDGSLGGVMLVPMPANPDAWEAAAEEAQQKLKDEVRK
jgi:hypothetical protein